MKIYKTESGILINQKDSFYLLKGEDWDSFINDDDLLVKAENTIRSRDPVEDANSLIENELQPPIQNQEFCTNPGLVFH